MEHSDFIFNGKDNEFTRLELDLIFSSCKGLTLGQLDRLNVFYRAISNPKITGIAGDVVEQSILGMKANSRQEPDLDVDGEKIELKTTGLRTDKDNKDEYVAKEPVTITAVSIDKIVKEGEFAGSMLWHKLQHILFVYYHYDSPVTVNALGYSEFRVLSYQFYEPSDLDRERYESDWIIVRDFLKKVQSEYESPEEGYPLLSTDINPKLVVLDTAPKYPNKPRFRIKRAYFTVIVKKHFSRELEMLSEDYVSYRQLDEKLHEIAAIYSHKNMGEIAESLGVVNVTKQMAEQLIVRMFGGQSKKLNRVELFEAFGIVGYSIALSAKDGRTEDTKMCSIDFDEVLEDKSFEESDFYRYYHDNSFLFFISKETQIACSAKGREVKVEYAKNEFLGFKRIHFDDDFIYKNVKPVWDEIRDLIKSNRLRFVPERKKDGSIIINKTGAVKGAPNFPKGSDGAIFVRGTSTDSNDKPVCINGIHMYRQNLWIRGDVIVSKLSEVPFV